MGSAGEVFIEDAGVYLYAHGAEDNWMIETVQSVLQKKKNWDDGTYLARMLFAAMTKGEESGDMGFGISNESTEPAILITVNCSDQTIVMKRFCGTERILTQMGLLETVEANPDHYREGHLLQQERAVRKYTFEEFISTDIKTLYCPDPE